MIFSGAAISSAPVGGNCSKLHRLARPNLPAPCMMEWFREGWVEAAGLTGVGTDKRTTSTR